MNNTVKRSLCGIAALVILLGIKMPAASKKASKTALRSKLHNVNSQIHSVQSIIRDKKRQQKYAKLDLQAAQQKLEDVQDSVIRNKLSLSKSQYQLGVINQRLNRNQRQLTKRSKLLSGRLVDLYKGDDIAYVNVVLGSRDMGSFMSRGYYVRKIISNDVSLINEIKKTRAAIEADKKRKSAEVARIVRLQSQLIAERDDVADLEDAKQARLSEIENDRAKYESMLAGLMRQSQEIENAIQRLQSTPAGKRRYARKFTGGLGQPVAGRITCPFGYRIHPITRVHSLHTGVDIGCRTGSSIRAAAGGEVILAGWMGAYGKAVVIDHGGGVSTLYGHNSVLCVRVGQSVSKGQVIAKSGSTGWSTGPHLHYEKRVNGKPVNPL